MHRRTDLSVSPWSGSNVSISSHKGQLIIFPQSRQVSLEDDRNEYARKRLEFESINRYTHWLEKRSGDLDLRARCDGDGESTDAG